MMRMNVVILVAFLPVIAGQCPVRSNSAAIAVGRNCRKSCRPGDNRCKKGRVCMCAHECGYSCINTANYCTRPPAIPNQSGFKVFRKHENGSYLPGATPPYMFDDILEYVCEPGYSRASPHIRHYCHGRRSWTQLGSTICTKWNSWSLIGSCSTSCGGGQQTVRRQCINGPGCGGISSRNVECNTQACPEWSSWVASDRCSASCGNGKRRETRRCRNGPGCSGTSRRSVNCNIRICPRQCPIRSNAAAIAVGRNCRRSCRPGDNRCKKGRVCMCAHECGYSCINTANYCTRPPAIPNQSGFKVFRKHENGSYLPGATPPYMFDDILEYVCEPGYSRASPHIRHYCHGRRSWTQLGSTICTNYSKCGKAGVRSTTQHARVRRVVGGSRAAVGSWPWHVVISMKVDSVLGTYRRFLGGGSLLNNRWVLTAAAIFAQLEKVGDRSRNIFLTFGRHELPDQLKDRLPAYVQVYDAAEILLHPDFSETTYDYDVALIKIGRQFRQVENRWELTGNIGWVNYTFHIRRVCLPCMEATCARNYLQRRGLVNERQTTRERCTVEKHWLISSQRGKNNNASFIITGFGLIHSLDPRRSSRGKTSPYLNEGRIELKNNSMCHRARDLLVQNGMRESVTFTDRMLCGVGWSVSDPIDACNGDGGSPLVREVRSEETGESCWVQIGIVSWGGGCRQSYELNGQRVLFPSYYTNVISVLPWIKQTISLTEWSEWTNASCSATCGGGRILQTRSCLSDSDCDGLAARYTTCNSHACPEISNWSAWSSLSSCSASCGIGAELQTRTCITDTCTGFSYQFIACNAQSCSA